MSTLTKYIEEEGDLNKEDLDVSIREGNTRNFVNSFFREIFLERKSLKGQTRRGRI